MDVTGKILLVPADSPATCPDCGRRLETPIDGGQFVEVGADIDGPIYAGACAIHGQILWQIDREEEENEFRR